MTVESTHTARFQRALLSLDGLSVGDSLGQLLTTCARSARRVIAEGTLPGPKWWHTDDTQMAMAIVEELAVIKRISPDSLAHRFAQRYQSDPGRGYGKGARMQLEQILAGDSWQQTSVAAFNGRGSKGNGGAMRVPPLGAYFADDLEQVVAESRASALITHSHPEGVAGSVAVAVAAGAICQAHGQPLSEAREKLWESVLKLTPEGETLDGIRKASVVPLEMEPDYAARLLGSGYLVTAPDTVPFALWCSARHLNDYQEAMISTLEGDGDCDTNCAIVGGIVALFVGRNGIPENWLKAREPLDLDL